MTHNDLVALASIALFLLALIGWRTESDQACPECSHCKAKTRQAERAKMQRAADQAEFRHDYEHKGMGWRDGDPDRYDCPDLKCSRNRHTQSVDSEEL